MCCKGNDKFGYLADSIYSIKKYLSHECDCSISVYTSGILENILFNALIDYINGVKNPGFVLWSLREDGKFKNSLSEKIVTMFSFVQVREGDDLHCINGFTEELLEQSKVDLNW
jgi:hypothetical protein